MLYNLTGPHLIHCNYTHTSQIIEKEIFYIAINGGNKHSIVVPIMSKTPSSSKIPRDV